jgi:hypothetical protein
LIASTNTVATAASASARLLVAANTDNPDTSAVSTDR